MIKTIALLSIVVSFATAAAAQGPPGLEKKHPRAETRITIKIAGLECTTALGSGTFSAMSYSFGASQDTTTPIGGGGGAGKAVVLPLNATKEFDECSPSLFGAVVTGKHFATVDLVQQDEKGHAILTINLTDALIGSYQISGNQSSDSPHESIQIDFRKICISEPSNGSKLCFDRSTNTTSWRVVGEPGPRRPSWRKVLVSSSTTFKAPGHEIWPPPTIALFAWDLVEVVDVFAVRLLLSNFGATLIQENVITGNGQISGWSGGVGGGGVSIVGASSAQLLNNMISGNSWSASGGGVTLFAAGTPTLQNNFITNNTASSQGGCVWIVNYSDALIVQNILVGNSESTGGGVYWLVPSGHRVTR